jgi:hypothetical protein
VSEGNEEVCGESYDHDLRIVDERDGIVAYECRNCGAEIAAEPDDVPEPHDACTTHATHAG